MAKQDSDRAKSVKQQRRPSPCKPYLSFSIDSILGRKEEEGEKTLNPKQVPQGKEAFTSSRRESEEEHKVPSEADTMDSTKIAQLPWLAYTRYSPPKLPRSRRKLKNCKRRSSGSPRVPFSTSQLMTLEQKYTENHYLSGSEVTELASSLNLPHHRIKIWFQNRRAREKRSQEENSMSTSTGDYPLLQQQVELNHTTACYMPFSLSKNLSMNCFGLGNYSHYKMLSRFVNVDRYSCGTVEF
ncbi:hypothetical protein ACROYT_G034810 [Oculina patagonica]